MSLAPLALGAWVSVCCGFTLLRPSSGPRRGEKLGPGRKRVVVGALLIITGLAVLAAALVSHF